MRARRFVCVFLLAALLTALFAPCAGAAGFPLERSGSWRQAEFRCRTAQPPVSCEWRVLILAPGGEWVQAQDFLTQELPAQNMLALVLKAPGEYRVSLVLDGAQSETYEALLLDDSALQAALPPARALAANPNKRYDAAYIAQLKLAIAAAEALYTQPAQAARAAMETKTADLEGLAASPVLARSSFAFLNRLAPGWWKFVDTVTAPLHWLQSYPNWGSFFTLLGEGLRAMVK